MKNKIKKVVESFAAPVVKKFGDIINPIAVRYKKENGRLLVFYFHGIFKSEDEKDLNRIDPQNNMTVTQFSDFITYFQDHNYKFILPSDLKNDMAPDQAYAMITFDDGYFNNMLAIDLLTEFKVPGVIFLATKNITENKAYWWDIIYRYRTKQGISLQKIYAEQTYLKKFKHPAIDDYILKNFGKHSFIPTSEIDRPFTPGEVQKLALNPYIKFANHTHNHAILTNYKKDEIKLEISTSSKIISELTQRVPISLAFPNGNFNNTVLEAVQDLGIHYAFTTKPGRNLLPVKGKGKTTCLKRYMTNTSQIVEFGSHCRLGYETDNLYDEIKMKTEIIKSKLKFLYNN